MTVILCYGDSNTWGYDPATQDRFPRDVRWTGVLRAALGAASRADSGADCWVIEEGLNGRTTVWDDPIEGYKNGREYLIPCLETHKPIDLVIIMLGTNDLKKRFSLSAYDIANGASVLVDVVNKSEAGPDGNAPLILLMAPPPLAKLTEFAEMFEGAEAKSRRFAQHYQRVAQEQGCAFLNTGDIIHSSDLDGVHFEADQHHTLGFRVAQHVHQLLA